MNNLQLLTGCICGISVLTSVVSCRRDDGKPNVLVIFTDDQRADALGCSGNRYIKPLILTILPGMVSVSSTATSWEGITAPFRLRAGQCCSAVNTCSTCMTGLTASGQCQCILRNMVMLHSEQANGTMRKVL